MTTMVMCQVRKVDNINEKVDWYNISRPALALMSEQEQAGVFAYVDRNSK